MMNKESTLLTVIVITLFLFTAAVLPSIKFMYISDTPFGLILGLALVWFRRYIFSIAAVLLLGLWGIASFSQSPYITLLYLVEIFIAVRVITPDISDKGGVIPFVFYAILCVLVSNVAEGAIAYMSGSGLGVLFETALTLLPLQAAYSAIAGICFFLLVRKISTAAS